MGLRVARAVYKDGMLIFAHPAAGLAGAGQRGAIGRETVAIETRRSGARWAKPQRCTSLIPLLSILAGRLKADHRLSVADAWIAALAKERDATLVHKDPEAGSCAVGETCKVFRRSHAHQPGDLVEVRIETGDIWDVENPGFQSQQRIMEIQAALMLAYQF